MNLQEPVDSKQQADIFHWEASGCENQQHSDESCTGYAGCTHTG